MGCYKIGKTPPQWSSKAQTITFVVTEDCNLRCKYCYITHKASNKKMSFETAKKFIDYILTADIETADSVIVDFFGGEPFMEVSLVDKISDYFKLKTYELNLLGFGITVLILQRTALIIHRMKFKGILKKTRGSFQSEFPLME